MAFDTNVYMGNNAKDPKVITQVLKRWSLISPAIVILVPVVSPQLTCRHALSGWRRRCCLKFWSLISPATVNPACPLLPGCCILHVISMKLAITLLACKSLNVPGSAWHS